MHILFYNYIFGCPKQAAIKITLAIFNLNADKVVKDAIFYARIQANNQYYKEILGQKMNKEIDPSSVYLTEEQYR
jgi:hypothetical protein